MRRVRRWSSIDCSTSRWKAPSTSRTRVRPSGSGHSLSVQRRLPDRSVRGSCASGMRSPSRRHIRRTSSSAPECAPPMTSPSVRRNGLAPRSGCSWSIHWSIRSAVVRRCCTTAARRAWVGRGFSWYPAARSVAGSRRQSGIPGRGSLSSPKGRRLRKKRTPSTGSKLSSSSTYTVTTGRSHPVRPSRAAALRPPSMLRGPAWRTASHSSCSRVSEPVKVLTTRGVRATQRRAAIWSRVRSQSIPWWTSWRRATIPAWLSTIVRRISFMTAPLPGADGPSERHPQPPVVCSGRVPENAPCRVLGHTTPLA